MRGVFGKSRDGLSGLWKYQEVCFSFRKGRSWCVRSVEVSGGVF